MAAAMEDPTDVAVEKAVPSCAECRRRKSKCDRGNPCDNCDRYGRECSYETVTRSPLTRKHLTRVEKELANTKALLRQYEAHRTPGTDGKTDTLEDPRSMPDNDSAYHSLNHSNGTHESQDLAAMSEDLGMSMNLNDSHPPSVRSTGIGSEPSKDTRVLVATNGQRPRSGSPAFSLENLPSQGDFDWDERVRSVNSSQFHDGMAALPNLSGRGYMGVTSGAALLRLADNTIDSGETEQANGDDNVQESYTIPCAIFSLSQLEPFVDAYFQTYHVSYPMIHEATFRAQFMEVIPRPKKGNAWQVLLHIVATLGSFAASETAPEVDLGLFEATKARMTIGMLETGNIYLVQALTLISNYVQKRNKPNSGYNYLGLAKRMAMGLGLHKEVPQWHSEPLRLEIRRRVYWCLYVFDVGAIITFSRPLDLPQDGIEIQLPLNVGDGDITSGTKRFPTEAQETTLYTHVRCQSQFHLATTGIYTRLISTPSPTADEMVQADDAHLEPWVRNIPSFYQDGVAQASKFRLSHSILQWRWRNFRILMYRPYLMRRFLTMRRFSHDIPAADYTAIQRCLKAAEESIRLITNYWSQGTQSVLACWYSLYFLFQATLIPVVCIRNEPNSELASDWRSGVIDALETISDMSRLNSAASRYYKVIMELCGAYIAQDMSDRISPTTESPLTQLNALNSIMRPMADPGMSYGYDPAFLESLSVDFVNEYLT